MFLDTLREGDFFGRKAELTHLYRQAQDTEIEVLRNIFLSGARGIGKTELLKQLFHHLFWGQDRVVPFYYSVSNAVLTVPEFSWDYLKHYICQRLAFEKKGASLINPDGLLIEGLTAILEEEKAGWGLEILDRYLQCREPVDRLREALNSPHQSIRSTGKHVVVMIDEFQRLKGLRMGAGIDSTLVSLFEIPLLAKNVLHLITGNQAEIQEMHITKGLARIDVKPLQLEDAAMMFSSLLGKYGIKSDGTPDTLLDYLWGNPFYIRSVAKAVRQADIKEISGKENFWSVYINEVSNGSIYTYWTAVFKDFIPEIALRRDFLEIIRRIYNTGKALTYKEIFRAVPFSSEYAGAAANVLLLSGFVNCEFGVFRAPADRVLRDFIDCLYMKEIQGKSYGEIEKEMLEKIAIVGEAQGVTFELKVPMVREAELVAARCLEQIGENLHISQEVIAQLQMAVIEACINAMEHSKGRDRNIYLKVDFNENRLEISVESTGREFVSPGTGEPYMGKEFKDDTGRGWGIKLIKSFTDSVRFEKTERGTKVILVKNLLKPDEIKKEDTAFSE